MINIKNIIRWGFTPRNPIIACLVALLVSMTMLVVSERTGYTLQTGQHFNGCPWKATPIPHQECAIVVHPGTVQNWNTWENVYGGWAMGSVSGLVGGACALVAGWAGAVACGAIVGFQFLQTQHAIQVAAFTQRCVALRWWYLPGAPGPLYGSAAAYGAGPRWIKQWRTINKRPELYWVWANPDSCPVQNSNCPPPPTNLPAIGCRWIVL